MLDQTRRQHLAEMLGYIACNHHHIDPDRFAIDLAFLEGVRERLDAEAAAFETTLRVSPGNLLALEIIADAAATYTHRGDPPPMDGVDEDDCDAMARWLAQQYTQLFCTPERHHLTAMRRRAARVSSVTAPRRGGRMPCGRATATAPRR